MEQGNMRDKEDLAKNTYSLFVQSMDTHYSEILKFLAIIIPSLTGFFYVLYQYESANVNDESLIAFLFVTLIVIIVQGWGAIYALAMSYRFRYLQATVSKIEEAFHIDRYMPISFKIKPITETSSRLTLSIAPAILQVHVFFFIISIVVLTVLSSIIIPYPYWLSVLIIGPLAIIVVFLMGALYYPNKLNKMLTNSNEGGD